MAPIPGHAVRPARSVVALALLLAFNAVAIALMVASGLPAHPAVFTAWFVGDMIAGLIALGLTERW
jgi:hypothetical protein